MQRDDLNARRAARTMDAFEPSRLLIQTRAEYVAALDALLPMARRSIQVFDPDLALPAFGDIARIEALRAFLRADRDNRLQIALHGIETMQRNMPRLLQLLRDFPDAIAIYRTEGEARRAQDCFVLVDARHFVRRPVAEQARGVYAVEEASEGRQLQERFEQIWEVSEPAVSPTQLGL